MSVMNNRRIREFSKKLKAIDMIDVELNNNYQDQSKKLYKILDTTYIT